MPTVTSTYEDVSTYISDYGGLFLYMVQPAFSDRLQELAPEFVTQWEQPVYVDRSLAVNQFGSEVWQTSWEQPLIGVGGTNYATSSTEFFGFKFQPQVTERGHGVETIKAVWYLPQVNERYGFQETFSATFQATQPRVRDVGRLTSAVFRGYHEDLVSTGHASETFSLGLRNLSDRFGYREAYTVRTAAVLADRYGAQEVWFQGNAGTWVDRYGAQELRTTTVTSTSRRTERARYAEAFSFSKNALVEIVGTFQPETIRIGLRNSLAVQEALGWAETMSVFATGTLTISEVSNPEEATTTLNSGSASVVDPSIVESLFLSTESGGWSTNTDGWQMTRYEGLPMDACLASLGGERYVGATSGLFRMDRAVPVVGARFASVWSDGGNDHLKLPRSLYLGYTSEQPLTVRMWITREGKDFGYDYVMPKQSAESMLPGRLMLGRGLRSRYLKYEVENTGGGYFYIDTALIDADVSTRRV